MNNFKVNIEESVMKKKNIMDCKENRWRILENHLTQHTVSIENILQVKQKLCFRYTLGMYTFPKNAFP